ncbi:mucin-5AC-like [Saccostrea echinata]|uniref:mucin-5AC-like n=1 Tax=Saccostrea echinata TaxID=191078 RepID=UPI002A801F73|nr:mucin-5AC-like [Saccostrea echinata]
MSFTEVANCGINMKIPCIGIILTLYLATEISEGAGRFNCKKPTLENGSARIRSKGRLVRFRCKRRFKLYGAKVAICRNEEWTFPTPVCVANGKKCPKLKKNKDMLITSNLRNGLLKYSCKSGFKLIGNSLLYCDGSKWSSEVPQCIYVEPKKSCDFETEDLCDWEQDKSDTSYFDWTRTTAAQIKHSTGTGPTSDHTYPDKNTGHYLFMEASRPRMPGDYTTLLSPYYNPVEAGLCFEFWYHMLGQDGEGSVGSLKVGIKDSDASSSNLRPVWNISGNQGKSWHKGSLEIGKRTSLFQIVITGTRGDDHRGDIAIDDVSITNCTKDYTTTESSTASTSFNESFTSSKTITTNKAQQSITVTQETSSVEETEKTQNTNSVDLTTDTTQEAITTRESTIRHTTLSHVTSNVTSVTKGRHIKTSTESELTNLTPDTTTIPVGETSISVTTNTKTTNIKTPKQGIKPTANTATSTTKSFVTTEFKTKPTDKESKAQQTTLATSGFKTKIQTTNQLGNPTTTPVSTSTLSSSKKPTKIWTSTVKSTAATKSLSSFTKKPTKITTVKSSTTTTVTSASSSISKLAKITTLPRSTKKLTTTTIATSQSQSTSKPAKIRTTTLRSTKKITTTSAATSQSRSTTKPADITKTTGKSGTTITMLPSSSTTKPTKSRTTSLASTKKLTTVPTTATSPLSSTKKSVFTTVSRKTGLTTTQTSTTSTGKTKSSTRKAIKTSFKTTKTPYQTISTTTLSTSTARSSAPSTISYLTTLRNFDFYNNTINEDVHFVTTHSTNDTDIPNIIVVGRQSASDDPPVRTLLIGLAAGVAVGLVIVVVGCYLWIRRKRRKELECDEMMPITKTGSQEW